MLSLLTCLLEYLYDVDERGLNRITSQRRSQRNKRYRNLRQRSLGPHRVTVPPIQCSKCQCPSPIALTSTTFCNAKEYGFAA